MFSPSSRRCNSSSAHGVRFRSKRAVLVLTGLLWLAGCAVPGPRTPLMPVDALPARVHLVDVPFHAQEALYCGPAALAMVLQFDGVDVDPDALAAKVFTPGRRGSLQSEMITAVRRQGRLAYPIQGLPCLLESVAAGQPVVVLQNLGLRRLPRWHYAVVVGYDQAPARVVLHTGAHAHRSVGVATFERTWRRADHWGLLVLAPDTLPACAEAHSWLLAALGLQQAGQGDAALSAFHAAVRQWPENVSARMALGNALYADGKTDAAGLAFSRATQLDPRNAAAFNNLAHVLAAQGVLREAEAAARRAVELGGPHVDIYRRTLDEILAQTAVER